MRILAVCHTIIVDQANTNPNDDQEMVQDEPRLTYNASSPDELALVNAARYFGMVFEDRDIDNNIVLLDQRTGRREKFELLDIIEFTSTRKRMSVVVRTADGRIFCMTKGADSIIIPRLHPG